MEFSENEKAPGVLFLAAAEKLKPPLEGAETPNGLLLLVVAGAPNTDDDVVLFAEPNAFEGPLVDVCALVNVLSLLLLDFAYNAITAG